MFVHWLVHEPERLSSLVCAEDSSLPQLRDTYLPTYLN